MENWDLKGRQARCSGEERKHQSWNPRRTCSGSCRMLKPGQEVYVSVCVCACLAFLCVWACVSLCGCACGLLFVWMHTSFSVCVCVCVWTPLKTPSQAPLFWGGNGAINSRVSPGSDPAIEALARKWLSFQWREKGGIRGFLCLLLSVSQGKPHWQAKEGREEGGEEVGGWGGEVREGGWRRKRIGEGLPLW